MTDARGNWVLVRQTESALRNGSERLDSVPKLLKLLLKESAWREFVVPSGELVEHARLESFLVAEPPRGLGTTARQVRRILGDDPVALDLLDSALAGHQGQRTDLVDNINEVRPDGTSREQALRRLRKDAPELHSDVLAGRLTAHGAMVKAGFRRKTFSVPAGDPTRIAATLRRQLDPGVLAELVKQLGETE